MNVVASAPALAPILAAHGISQRQLARSSGQSLAAINAIVARGEWPKRATAAVRRQVIGALRQLGATTPELRGVALPALAHKKAPSAPTPGASGNAIALPSIPAEATNPNQEDEQVYMRHESLTPLARERFKLPRNPFVDDINCREDVYQALDTRRARAALMNCASSHGFMALMGESGSGKSTLREEFEERIREEDKPIIVIKPYIVGSEPTDTRGKAIKAGQIAEAIVNALAPGETVRSSPQARYKQVHELLKASLAAGYCNLLLIEEAHRLSKQTLKHLKNFMELKDGLRRALGVCLIGQTREMLQLLNERDPEVREIVQRCEQVTLQPLDADLEGYLAHKFSRIGIELGNVLAPDAIEAIRARLVTVPRGGTAKDAYSICYPLVVNNLVVRALNTAAAAGWEQVTAEVVAEC